MTRTVGDAALLMSVLAGPDPRDRHSLPAGDVDWLTAPRGGVRGLRVAFSTDWGYLPVDPEVREITARAALPCGPERLNQIGHQLVRETDCHRHPHILGCCDDRKDLRFALRNTIRSWAQATGMACPPIGGVPVPVQIAYLRSHTEVAA